MAPAPRPVAGAPDGLRWATSSAPSSTSGSWKIGTNGDEITPEGGFLHYGLVRGPYVLIKGSVPGPNKRLVRIRPAIRQGEHTVRTPTINFVSAQSKQG